MRRLLGYGGIGLDVEEVRRLQKPVTLRVAGIDTSHPDPRFDLRLRKIITGDDRGSADVAGMAMDRRNHEMSHSELDVRVDGVESPRRGWSARLRRLGHSLISSPLAPCWLQHECWLDKAFAIPAPA